MSQQQSESGQQQQLGIIAERLENLVKETQLAETDQLYEEVREEIRSLNRKVILPRQLVAEYYLHWTTMFEISFLGSSDTNHGSLF